MTFDLTPTAAQHDLARRTHEFAEEVVRPVALDYDQRQEFPWPVLEEAAVSARMFRHTRRSQTRGAGDFGTRRRQRRSQPAHPRPPRR
jgi:hypothetical protein